MARLAAPGLTRDRGAISGPLELGACRSIEGCHGFAGAPRACGGVGGPFRGPPFTRRSGRQNLARVALRLHAPDIRGAIRLVVLLVVVDPVERAGAGADPAADERALTAARDRAAERADRRAAEGADAGVLRGVGALVVLAPHGPALGGR